LNEIASAETFAIILQAEVRAAYRAAAHRVVLTYSVTAKANIV